MNNIFLILFVAAFVIFEIWLWRHKKARRSSLEYVDDRREAEKSLGLSGANKCPIRNIEIIEVDGPYVLIKFIQKNEE